MIFLGQDGGPESNVHGFGVEFKRWFSVLLLRFKHGGRYASAAAVYHSHAFDCVSWVLKGRLRELHLDGPEVVHTPSLLPIVTRRATFHHTSSVGDTWVFTLRGPWLSHWYEAVKFHWSGATNHTFFRLEDDRVFAPCEDPR